MKFRIPDREDYRLTIPSVHLWMKDGYCPLVKEALGFDDIHARMQEYKEIEVKAYIYRIDTSKILWDITFMLNACLINLYRFKRSIYGDELINEDLCLEVSFYDGTSTDLKDDFENYRKHVAIFPFDERLYLIPYLFRAVKVNVMWNGKMMDINMVVDVPEHWRRLEKLGLIEPDILRNCLRLRKGPVIQIPQ